MSPKATWNSNFRDLAASVIRMGAYAENGRITLKIAEEEIDCLQERWSRTSPDLEQFPLLVAQISREEGIKRNDLVDLVEMEVVIEYLSPVPGTRPTPDASFTMPRSHKKPRRMTATGCSIWRRMASTREMIKSTT